VLEGERNLVIYIDGVARNVDSISEKNTSEPPEYPGGSFLLTSRYGGKP
jgi:hypothetical protein